MAEVELTIAGRPYRVACRNGEEENLRAAGALVERSERLAERLESIADALEQPAPNA